ncbi:hypothetical protein AB0L14_21070 [Streptomyces sp. NPDC052727]|uniref:hypothetical protein n=1 Tax=Streptomyces sp. NPDC052727 TaxID=3154854 RepID=UPI0034322DEF
MPGGSTARGYEFRIASPVPEAVAESFHELEAVVIGKQTVFYGDVIDEAHLFGRLARSWRGADFPRARTSPLSRNKPCGNCADWACRSYRSTAAHPAPK